MCELGNGWVNAMKTNLTNIEKNLEENHLENRAVEKKLKVKVDL